MHDMEYLEYLKSLLSSKAELMPEFTKSDLMAESYRVEAETLDEAEEILPSSEFINTW